MEHFAQTNVFAWISTVFAHLIIGCAIRYPKIGNLRYLTTSRLTLTAPTIAAELMATVHRLE